jgi:hypothetical protein
MRDTSGLRERGMDEFITGKLRTTGQEGQQP